jgi:uncharacterized iron-regulated membrane protein
MVTTSLGEVVQPATTTNIKNRKNRRTMSEDPHDLIGQQHTVIMPQGSIFSLIAQNMSALAWIGMSLAGFATIVLAWERKADKKQLAALEKRVRKLEQQVVRVTVLQERKK